MLSTQLLQQRTLAKPASWRRVSRNARLVVSSSSRGTRTARSSTTRIGAPRSWSLGRRTDPRRHTVRAADPDALSPSSPHLQLGTAKLPQNVVVSGFSDIIYQWAAGLTQSGSNLPFASPLRSDKLANGFKIDLLGRLPDGGFAPVAILVATVESEPAGNILYIRLYEGSAAWSTALVSEQIPPVGSPDRLERLLNSQPDIKLIMQTFPAAIRKAVSYAQ